MRTSDVDTREQQVIIAAREEIAVLDTLSSGLSATISDLLRQRPQFEKRESGVEFAINELKYSSLEAYRELAQRTYGRTVVGEETNEDGSPLRPFTYRITQANVGFIDGGCNVLARNSLIASKLVSVDAGEEVEVEVPARTRFLVAKQVRVFDGPTSLLSSSQRPNFRSMVLSSVALGKELIVRNLRQFLQSDDADDRVVGQVTTEVEVISNDPTWIDDWSNISLGDSENTSLSVQFFTRTTTKQENALNNPRGISFVEGVAGSGKTSVALGRLKFFANFESGEHLDEYGLRGAGAKDFSPTNMVGFVLSHSLRRYLKEAATELSMPLLPVFDFREFRADLSNRYGLTRIFKRNRAEAPSCRTQLSWLLAIDAALAQIAAKRLREVLDNTPELAAPVQSVVRRIADDLQAAEPNSDRTQFHLAGLASRVCDVAMSAEFRAREAAIRMKMATETLRVARVDLQNDLDRVLRDEERRVVSPLARKLLDAIQVQDMIGDVTELDNFDSIVRGAFNDCDESQLAEVDGSVASFCSALQAHEDQGLRSISDADLTTLAVLSAITVDGFDRPEAPPHYYQIRRRTAVFIDEVQDFTEIEILLMGMTATSAYSQITLSGDRRQRLQERGTEEYRGLFPFISRAQMNPTIFLDKNFRQREPMATLSAGYRALLQEGSSNFAPPTLPPVAYLFDDPRDMADFVLQRLLTIDPYATVAVILPDEPEARRWYGLLRDDLGAYHRPALLSHRDDLTRRNDIHFADVRETKGLEFDVVIVPDISSFTLDDVVGRNRLYVALTRPRHALLMGMQRKAQANQHLRTLIEAGLLEGRALPDHPAA
ncbi:hypothetical protein ABIC09_006308 [Bradyrhizobium sp. S3.12.5]|uniref:ATP-binding domain-containing protein n=1 Tax=Bradyrhizobium sp. S3.12.5 TaxID=3156386 RepID=UPI003396D430